MVVNLDLENFFPERRLPPGPERSSAALGLLAGRGHDPGFALHRVPEAHGRLRRHDLPRRDRPPRGLPQGASTSPGLSNQVARRLDRRLAGLAAKLGRDLHPLRRRPDVLGRSRPRRPGRLPAGPGPPHRPATRASPSTRPRPASSAENAAQVVTGLVVNDRPGVPRDEVRRLRAILHRARHEGLEAQNRDGHPDFRAWLRGKIAYVGMARPEVGGRLLAELEALIETGG